ncbi:CgeB family protein [Paenibacillus sp. CMAA1364]
MIHPEEEARFRELEEGFTKGHDEGYLRGRANAIMNIPLEPVPQRPLRILYVSSGKGYPYSPLDEAIIHTLQRMVAEVTITDPRQPIVEIATSMMPDLTLILDGMDVPVEHVDAIRQHGIQTAIWLTDDPYYTDITTRLVHHYDHVFTLELNTVFYYRQMGCPSVHHLPFAAHLEHYRPTTMLSPIRRDISFIGSAYWNRIEYLHPILPQLMTKNMMINGIWWDRLPRYQEYSSQIEVGKWMEPIETSQVYSGSKIILNLHRSHLDDSVNNNMLKISGISPNPRTFEISACATLQLVDQRDDLTRYYTPGVEIETYSSQQELLDKVDFYLTHEKERCEIALNALKRTVKDHTYVNRLNEMLNIIFS